MRSRLAISVTWPYPDDTAFGLSGGSTEGPYDRGASGGRTFLIPAGFSGGRHARVSSGVSGSVRGSGMRTGLSGGSEGFVFYLGATSGSSIEHAV